jgi:hypothetical protein
MRGLLLGTLLGVGLAAMPGPAAGQPAPAKADKTPWLTSYDEARAAARQTGKPLLVVFR